MYTLGLCSVFIEVRTVTEFIFYLNCNFLLKNNFLFSIQVEYFILCTALSKPSSLA